MKTNAKTRMLPAEFGPETRFEIRPVAEAPFRVVLEDTLESLKSRLLAARLQFAWSPEQAVVLRRAANEAVSLAWATPYPLLVFPTLFEEKADGGIARLKAPAPARRAGAEVADHAAA
jgi:hypothetical protein